ncbi:Aste57867_1434 [Aphanomyces stellatus]|uniref:Aste57867_1434 protein n=1 Tax=Aphanomyces stellatus TaxID=120398 RepID=A0A485K532_9STRA|nr:hypothetical protein As57867_001433 [Aphanomyces stellatus]VFT78651.1 Aste57867_1434 [Aphanomyces stellatus]
MERRMSAVLDAIGCRDGTRVAQKRQRRLNRGQEYQRRYRADQKQHNSQRLREIAWLEMEVARLQGRTESLRAVLPGHLRTFEPQVRTMAEYFRLFARGYEVNDDRQQGFLAATMREDMFFMNEVGADKLVGQWKAYASIFASFNMDIRSINVVASSPDVVVHAHATMYLRISRRTIETLFRHLLHGECLTQHLIGQVLELPVQMCFVFDTDIKVFRYDTHANIVLGLSKLFGTFENAVEALDHFHMRENAEIPQVNDPY